MTGVSAVGDLLAEGIGLYAISVILFGAVIGAIAIGYDPFNLNESQLFG
jgi:uncharacterized membrane-anchored protein